MSEMISDQRSLGRIAHWTARAWSAASLVLIAAFFVGEGFHPARLSRSDLALFLFFPVGVGVGMIAAWAKEGLGGGVTVASLAGVYLVHLAAAGRPPSGWAFLAFSAPGFLFLLSWLCSRGRARSDG